MRTAIVLILAATLSFVAISCGDDDGDGTSSPSPNGSVDQSAEGQLRDSAGKWANASGKITYTLTNALGDAEVIVYRQPSSVRIDHTLADRTTAIVVREDLGYSCSSISNSCALLTREDALEAATFVPYLTTLADNAAVDAIIAGADTLETVEARQIAGVNSSCVKGTGDLGGIAGPTTFCFSEEGLLLAVKYEGNTAFDMTAIAVGEVSDGDFEAPYAVVTTPPTATP